MERIPNAYQKWRKIVLKRDKYTCQGFGVNHHKELHVHHIKSNTKQPEIRFEPNNGITLCKDCHRDIHKLPVNRKRASSIEDILNY